jgi:RNA polymerase sigma-70 factor, ECF subfamily
MTWGNRHSKNSGIDRAQIEAEVMELCSQHMATLSRYAASLTRQQTIIHNAMQETFLRYFFTRVGGGRVENPRAWLARVLRDGIMERCRRSGSMLALESVEDSRSFLSLEEAADQNNHAFRRAIASLSERERECLQLRIEGYVYDELAQIMRMKKSAVGLLLSRALKKIRDAEEIPAPRYLAPRKGVDTYNLVSHMRLAMAETQYRKRVLQRTWTYLLALGLLTAAAALATVLMK